VIRRIIHIVRKSWFIFLSSRIFVLERSIKAVINSLNEIRDDDIGSVDLNFVKILVDWHMSRRDISLMIINMKHVVHHTLFCFDDIIV
jgi:hypothetical protein